MNKEEIEQLVSDLRDDVREIKLAVVGDTTLGIKGHGKRIDALEKWRDKLSMKVAFASGAGACVVFIAKAGIEYLSRK